MQANQLLAQGQVAAASELRNRAFEAAPAAPGSINDQPFEWIADGDSRLGPIIEVIIDGKYYWVPFFRVRSIRTEPPAGFARPGVDRCAVCLGKWRRIAGLHSDTVSGHRESCRQRVRLAGKTEWVDQGNDLYLGLGQRMFATDQAEIALTEVRQIELSQP